MISATGVRYFAEVNRRGSFRAAAEHLVVASSAISRQIALLEEELGAPVFERGRGRSALRLTAAGEILMQYASSMENEMQRVQSEIEALRGLRKGHVRIGVPESFTRDFFPDFLASFSRRYPRITFQVEVAGTPRLLDLVIAGELDATLTFNPPPMANIEHIFERMLATCVLVPRGHPLADRTSVRLSDCAEYGMALPGLATSAKRVYDEMFAKAKIRPHALLVSNSHEMLRAVAMQGMGIAILNAHLNEKASPRATYRYVPIRDPRVKPQRLTVGVRQGRSLPVAAATFVDSLLQTLAVDGKS